MKPGLIPIRTLGILAVAVTLAGRDCPAQDARRSIPLVSPGDPSSSTLGNAPGASGTVNLGGSGVIEQVIPVGPGPS